MADPAVSNIVNDLRAEGDDLFALLQRLEPEHWASPTTFKSWTVYDVVAHLHMSDHMAVTTIADGAAFKAFIASMRVEPERGGEPSMKAFAREWLGDVSPGDLLARWRSLFVEMCDRLQELDPDTRLTWAGPGMRPRMFTTARQMETWAHGQEIYDLLNEPRQATERLRNIAEIGVRTFGWTYANRQLAVPETAPKVSLVGPAGSRWEWNLQTQSDSVSGDAVEFCQVVTQVRNIADTRLAVNGPIAAQWMSMAQCFAGSPEDPPAPGSRAPGSRAPGTAPRGGRPG
jgi:uncharacterized protein (TIGR03084 family)